MIDKIQNNPISQVPGRNSVPHPEVANQPPTGGSDATLRTTFADLINQAKETSETETDAVRKARELLQSGQLTSPQNLQSAAESILTLGI